MGLNYTRRLALLVTELEPERPPWFVSRPAFRSLTPSVGWWWIPRGAAQPAFLGHNHIVAELQVQTLLESLERPHA